MRLWILSESPEVPRPWRIDDRGVGVRKVIVNGNVARPKLYGQNIH